MPMSIPSCCDSAKRCCQFLPHLGRRPAGQQSASMQERAGRSMAQARATWRPDVGRDLKRVGGPTLPVMSEHGSTGAPLKMEHEACETRVAVHGNGADARSGGS